MPRSHTNGRFSDIPGDFMEAIFRWMDLMTGFIRFRLKSAGTCQNLQSGTVAGFYYRISATSRLAAVGNGKFPERFSPEIHGILLQKSLTWVRLKLVSCKPVGYRNSTRPDTEEHDPGKILPDRFGCRVLKRNSIQVRK